MADPHLVLELEEMRVRLAHDAPHLVPWFTRVTRLVVSHESRLLALEGALEDVLKRRDEIVVVTDSGGRSRLRTVLGRR